MEVAWEETIALSDPRISDNLPAHIFNNIKSSSGEQYLDTLASAALDPVFTDKLYIYYEHIFTDIAARWLSPTYSHDYLRILGAFARLLPIASHLKVFAEAFIEERFSAVANVANEKANIFNGLGDGEVLEILHVLFRLFSFDASVFGKLVEPKFLLELVFRDGQRRDVRYFAIRCFSLFMHAADAAVQEMVARYLGDEAVKGPWEGQEINYKLLSLCEEGRWKSLLQFQSDFRTKRAAFRTADLSKSISPAILTPRTALIGATLVPRVSPGHAEQGDLLVSTPTTQSNLSAIGEVLLDQRPILLLGRPGSGKTSLLSESAKELNQLSSMITLHLNEQTDAKSLLGMYTTSSMTGSFMWQPGSLTKAVREGRWILIEDIDRAPSEVLGVLLPLIEKGELLIPSRKERIRCARGFRLLATMRSTTNSKGEVITSAANMLGARLWQQVHVQDLPLSEIQEILESRFPVLGPQIPLIMKMYARIHQIYQENIALRGSQRRVPGLRDLVKMCRRVEARIKALGSQTGHEPLPDAAHDDLFLDALDCFAGYVSTSQSFAMLAGCIAEELHISPQKADFCVNERIPAYEEAENFIQIGRGRCQRLKSRSALRALNTKKAAAFAVTRPALKTMEQVAAATESSEPVLLVGETGIGKTTVVQQLAYKLGQKLTVVNLSQQSESTDLLGGFKPINARSLAMPMSEEFENLFDATFSAKKNQKFLSSVSKAVARGNWSRASLLWREALKMADAVFRPADAEQPAKKRKLGSSKLTGLRQRWDAFTIELSNFEAQVSKGDANFAFAFVEGKIVKALRNGEWVLLDEINLASPDTLENIAGLLHSGYEGSPSIILSEAGDVERVKGHPNFRVFGAMNPATDAGKRDLAPGIRSRFTEYYIQSPDNDLGDLQNLIETYLGQLLSNDERASADIGRLYLDIKALNTSQRLTDGAGQRPHFSVRTLVRCLIYTIENMSLYGLRRALYEGFSMSFLTLLSQESERLVIPLIDKYILGSHSNARSLLKKPPRAPGQAEAYVNFKHYWLLKGAQVPQEQPHYIITPFIEKNLLNLVRASSLKRFPILIQGPTSAGKTSMVEYLSKISGNKFVRINNHEHTDLQEYLGSYQSGENGSLQYQEGVLVEALRKGYWIVLDELNLAPTDVLEALNRLLDDNRELLIPETQEVIRPHPNFMLFATQNPAGLYGGRKVLSRAFRNRFLELHFDDIPEDELEFILRERSQIAPSFCTRIVSVYKKLSVLRQSERLFEQRNSFATLRDLFRWAQRRADDKEQLAINGFMLLGERVRNPKEKTAVKEVIEEVMKVKIDENALYSTAALQKQYPQLQTNSGSIIWTAAMRRLFALIAHAIENQEPVLLVGETGCGKTQVCQTIAQAYEQQLDIVNAHVNTETGDLIGAQRPVRNRSSIEASLRADIVSLLSSLQVDIPTSGSLDDLVKLFLALNLADIKANQSDAVDAIKKNISRLKSLFEWCDGSLVTAMKAGNFFLLDEISLADDSVLERLNSVLEPSRTILLAEKGLVDSNIVAHTSFRFLATMNPGGDYGKRELSAALRNRLTEIWVPPLTEDKDILPILESRVKSGLPGASKGMLKFAKWFKNNYQGSVASHISIRDLLAWVEFVNTSALSSPERVMTHGAAMVFIDTLGANPAALLAMKIANLDEERKKCVKMLGTFFKFDATSIYYEAPTVSLSSDKFQIGEFSLALQNVGKTTNDFVFDAPTTVDNSMRIVRAMQSTKPILLEGSPGVGKTTLITALAKATGRPLTRINLSDQTDLSDLFGSDVPIGGEEIGRFEWRDAPFLQAMQRGEWVLLDEMNLASQAVLEGLNSCLDHRQEVYISELDQRFQRHPDFVLFAAQNPHHQGGGRKGLPASFVNRFTVVYADSFKSNDLNVICRRIFPHTSHEDIERLVAFVSTLHDKLTTDVRMGSLGGPWEVNLRDIYRWLSLLNSSSLAKSFESVLDVAICQRFRTEDDRRAVLDLFKIAFGTNPGVKSLYHNLTPGYYQVGYGVMPRTKQQRRIQGPQAILYNEHLHVVESLLMCVQQAWPALLVGAAGSGKTTVLRHLASISGNHVVEISLNADVDTMDLVGGFEQYDPQRQVSSFLEDLDTHLQAAAIEMMTKTQLENLIATFTVQEALLAQPMQWDDLRQKLAVLAETCPQQGFEEYLSTCTDIIEIMRSAKPMGFEWMEGILIEAITKGHWVILDNANLCSSSVLDRLNSLLEPQGTLVLNEQHSADGGAKVVSPHPNFRIFLTMDPKHGELSRAMRNRAIEIFMTGGQKVSSNGGLQYSDDSSVYRLRHLQSALLSTSTVSEETASVALDQVSTIDFQLLESTQTSLISNLQDLGTASLESLATAVERRSMLLAGPQSARQDFSALSSYDINDVPGLETSRYVVTHPLVNEPLITDAESSIAKGQMQDLHLALIGLHQALSKITRQVEAMVPSQMTPLERSIASLRNPKLARESTAPVASFLSEVGNALNSLFLSLRNGQAETSLVKSIKTLLDFCTDLFSLTHDKHLDEGAFMIFLQKGWSLLTQNEFAAPSSSIAVVTRSALEKFNASWKLTSGLSMQRMWPHFRPKTAKSLRQLHSLLKLDTVEGEFQSLAWNANVSIADLAATRQYFSAARHIILESDADAEELFEKLVPLLENLRSNAGNGSRQVIPFFAQQFEGLCQYYDLIAQEEVLQDQGDMLGRMALLAGRTTNMELIIGPKSNGSELLSQIATFSGSIQQSEPLALKQTTCKSILERLHQIDNVTLDQMDLLLSELRNLAEAISRSSSLVAGNQLMLLNKLSMRILTQVLLCHQEVDFDAAASQLANSTPDPNFIKSMYESLPQTDQPLQTLLSFLSAPGEVLDTGNNDSKTLASMGRGFVVLALTILRLYVPDRPLDPSLDLVIDRQRYDRRQTELRTLLHALTEFELLTTGQPSNLRSRLVSHELEHLGDAPPLPPVVRPETSQISQLAGEFKNLLNSIDTVTPENVIKAATDPVEAAHIQQIIAQLVSRLTNGFPAYQDITTPVIQTLHFLSVGLKMCALDLEAFGPADQILRYLSETTPFIGASAENFIFTGLPREPHRVGRCDTRFHFLSVLATAQTIDPSTVKREETCKSLLEILRSLYFDWKAQLALDQKEEAQKSSLYRYKGGTDDDEINEEDVRELFPVYEIETEKDDDADKVKSEKSKIDPRMVAIKIASAVQRILHPGAPEEALKSLLVTASNEIAALPQDSSSSIASFATPQQLLPGILLRLQSELENLDVATSQNKPFDFYSGSSPAESTKLHKLVGDIVLRFQTIQKTWPEHAALADVLTCCNEIYAFKHSEPISKYITKAEKLHGYIYEWQLVASKEFSAVGVYDQLTNLLISWRRLELSTWSRLLDVETQNAAASALSWWFVAFETLVAAPLGLIESGQSLDSHLKQLLSTLESFMAATSLGQFSPKLRLIETFKELLLRLADMWPALNRVVCSLSNFLAQFVRHEDVIEKSITQRRSVLEKTLKQEIQLASWKDTNITALKESARRSHHKLFKIVRKYRAILNESAEPFLQKEPDTKEAYEHSESQDRLLPATLINDESLSLCQKHILTWSSKPARYTDPEGAARSMIRVFNSAIPEFSIASSLDEFTTDVIETSKSLKSETPSTLTEDNKDLAQHLKAQKRKFFAEKLRQIREMGIKSNLGADLLDEQSSTAIIMATTADFSKLTESGALRSADDYFRRVLDLMPRVRVSVRDFNEDLTNHEVARSTGSMEGLLALIRRQRKTIGEVGEGLSSFGLVLKQVENFATASHSSPVVRSDNGQSIDKNTLRTSLACLSGALGLGSEILKLHCSFSKERYPDITAQISAWKSSVESLMHRLSILPILPSGLSTLEEDQVVSEGTKLLKDMGEKLNHYSRELPQLNYIFDQISKWTCSIPSSQVTSSNQSKQLSLDDFDRKLMAAADNIFVGMQNLSSALTSAPASVEDATWLSKSDSAMSKAVLSLRIGNAASSLREVSEEIHNMSANGNVSDIAIASFLFATILPILHQYQSIAQHLMEMYASTHRETCKMTYVLGKSLMQLASEGFCSPQEASGQESGAGKMESGTGLGEGEGAEDISKDVQDDEDLSELAQQEKAEGDQNEIEDNENAVNMNQEDLQGDMDESAEQRDKDENEESGDEDEDGDDIDSEVGSVDGMDDNAVDEKMWDGKEEENQKETENNEGKGDAGDDQNAAAEDKKEKKDKDDAGEDAQDGEEEEEDEEMEGDDEGDAVGREENEVTDPHTNEGEALELPEEMQLDGEEMGDDDMNMNEEDDAFDDLSDVEDEKGNPIEDKGEDEIEDDKNETADHTELDKETGEQEDQEMEETEEGRATDENQEEQPADQEEDDQDRLLQQKDEDNAEADQAAESEAPAGAGAEHQDQDNQASVGASTQQDGEKNDKEEPQEQTGPADQGSDGQQTHDLSGERGQGEDAQQDPQQQAFKQLGDALQDWHRQQRQILDSVKDEKSTEEQGDKQDQDVSMADVDFEHLTNEDDVPDAQALGAAEEEQTSTIDQSKAIESADRIDEQEFQQDNQEDAIQDNDAEMEEDIPTEPAQASTANTTGGSFMANPDQNARTQDDPQNQASALNDIEDVDHQLSDVHLGVTDLDPLTSPEEAQRLWSHYESQTRELSLSLTEQLRLILAPTLATKLRGDYRTGKRLNIKRIIPYIASQYKRDKIWMRRSVPSKRNYQIMLAVDDSKSMLESGSGQLAFETLALVTKSLSMLEVGDVSIVNFGNEERGIRVAHDFGEPFSAESGPKVFQQFSYQQTGTNVRRLIAESITLFRNARNRQGASSGNGADLWQLQLIISDGICEDHETIARLVRQAQEERIMIVFIIVDAVKGNSILDLSQASFEADGMGEMKLKMKKYLEGFPFNYYLVVRDVRELPGVLSMALKQWFAEVVDSSA